MSVLLMGMELPKDGFITITVTSDGRVVGNSKKENGKFEYLDNEDIAKAVPVPEHGRLIDADALIEQCHGHNSQRTIWGEIEYLVDDAPTIISAEPLSEEVNE